MKKAGHPVAKLGEYWDDLHGVMGEIRRRQGKNPHRRNPKHWSSYFHPPTADYLAEQYAKELRYSHGMSESLQWMMRLMTSKEKQEVSDRARAINRGEISSNPHRRNPYPNEHAARLHAPGTFRPSTFRSKSIGKGIRIILAKRKGAPRGKRVADPTVVQAFRFSNALYTPGQARAWLAKHHVRPKRFEPATAPQASTRRHLAKKSKRHIRRRRIA
jgi:hypothetical protein